MRRKIHIIDGDTVTSEPMDELETPAETAETDASAVETPELEVSQETEPIQDLDAEAMQAQLEELGKQIEQERKSAEEARNQYLRTLADFQNFRRRSEEQKGESGQFANRELILGLLPIIDNFERALAAAEKSQSYESLVGGVGLTLRQILDYLKKNGVDPIDAVGKEFDPNFHEAVMRVDDGEHPENTVVDELQRGYTMHARVLRPSMVKVARSE